MEQYRRENRLAPGANVDYTTALFRNWWDSHRGRW